MLFLQWYQAQKKQNLWLNSSPSSKMLKTTVAVVWMRQKSNLLSQGNTKIVQVNLISTGSYPSNVQLCPCFRLFVHLQKEPTGTSTLNITQKSSPISMPSQHPCSSPKTIVAQVFTIHSNTTHFNYLDGNLPETHITVYVKFIT